jgi:hypothetical protein
LIVVATTIWVGVDASHRDWSDGSFADKTWKWVVGSLLLWIVVFPVYLVKRGSAPRKA